MSLSYRPASCREKRQVDDAGVCGVGIWQSQNKVNQKHMPKPSYIEDCWECTPLLLYGKKEYFLKYDIL